MRKNYRLLFLAAGTSLASIAQTNRLPLVEGFTSNTCAPCASYNANYSPILSNNAPNIDFGAQIAVVKYQMNWPSPGTDPSYNDDADSRKGFYGVSGIPNWFIDANSINGTQTEIDNAKQTDGWAEIDAAYTLSGNDITVNVEFTPLVDMGAGTRLYIAITQKQYNYSGGTNGESSFEHVQRVMLPNAGGTYFGVLDSGEFTTHSETFTYNVAGTPTQGSTDFWNNDFEVVVWLQKAVSTKDVWNAAIAAEGTVGLEDKESQVAVRLSPNPALDYTRVNYEADGVNETVITVYDLNGKLVYQESDQSTTGFRYAQINTEDLSKGVYQVVVQQGDKMGREKLVVQ
jgi:hypothetical protein